MTTDRDKKVILVVIDGLTPSMFEAAVGDGRFPALSFLADFVGSLAGAKRVGASPLALAGAALGGGIGIFFGIPGILAGPFVGAVAGEFLARGRLAQAGKVGLGTWLGLIVAAVAKVVIAFLMIATFFASWILA